MQENFTKSLNLSLLLVLGVLLLMAFIYFCYPFLLITYVAIIFAVILHSLASQLKTFLPISYTATLIILVLTGLAIFIALMSFSWPILQQQFTDIWQTLPATLEKSLNSLNQKLPIATDINHQIENPEGWIASHTKQILSGVGKALGSILGVFSGLLYILLVGFYFALKPEVYTQGLISFLPKKHHGITNNFLHEIGEKLQWWVAGRCIAMFVVAVGVYVGLKISSLALAAAFSIIAGLFVFIPIIGPALSFIFPAFFAFESPETSLLGVALTFAIVQLVESYFLTPIIEQRTVSIPPALTIIALTLSSILMGPLGAMLAAPILVACITAKSTLFEN